MSTLTTGRMNGHALANHRSDMGELIRELESGGAVFRGTNCRCVMGTHEDKNASGGVYRDDADVCRYKCHSCGFNGDVFDVRARLNNRPVADELREFRRHEQPPNGHRPAVKKPDAKPAIDWTPMMERLRSAMTDDRLAALSEATGLPASVWSILSPGFAEGKDFRDLHAGFGDRDRAYPDSAFAFAEQSGDGRIVGITLRAVDGRKGFPSGGNRGIVIPAGMDEMPGDALSVEGASDVATVTGAMGIPSVGRPSNRGGAAEIAQRLAHRDILIVGENDRKADGTWPGRDGAIAVAQQVADQLKKPVRWTMPPEGTKDIRDYFLQQVAAGLDVTSVADMQAQGIELLDALQQSAIVVMPIAHTPAEAAPAAPGNSRAQIIARGRQLPEVTAEVIQSLAAANNPPVLFTRGGAPARIRIDDKGKSVIIQMSEAAMRGRMARVADFFAPGKEDSLNPIAPPLDVVRDAMTLDLHQHDDGGGEVAFPTIEAVTEIPVLRADGSVLTEPGYDRATRLFYSPAANLAVPSVSENPTKDDIRRAVGLLDETFGEFPYELDADRANGFGTVLTPFIRPAIKGKSPIALFDAPQAGTGKSLFVEAFGRLATGDSPAMMGAPTDDGEMRKQITATLLPGPTIVVIDNIDAPLTSPSLARAITASVWSDRVLGLSQQANLTADVTWIGTGNNIELGGDMPRRCYRIRLDAKTSRPWKGRTFTHPNLMEWVSQNRGQLIWAALTIARAWRAAGQPVPADVPVIGGFESWSKTIGGILRFAGIDGFLSNLEDLYEQSDDGANEWERFLRAWFDRFGSSKTTTSQIVEDLQSDSGALLRDSLPEELAGFVVFQPAAYMQAGRFTVKDSGRFKIRLGKQLRQRVGRRYGNDGLHLSREDDTHTKTAVWWVGFAGSEGSGGSCTS